MTDQYTAMLWDMLERVEKEGRCNAAAAQDRGAFLEEPDA